MNRSILNKIGLVFLAITLLGHFSASAQDNIDNHFIYIQAKNKKPFYVILKSKVYSSSSIGYLIIPKLQDGNYGFRVGFPKSEVPEQNFTCTINGSDMGFSLQKNDAGSFGLLNLQTKAFLASSGATDLQDQYIANNTTATGSKTDKKKQDAKKEEVAKSTVSTSSFGNMLSGAINDPTLKKQTEPEKIAPPKQEIVATPKEEVEEAQQQVAVAEKKVVDTYQQQPTSTTVLSNLSVEDLQTYGVIKSKEEKTGKGKALTFVLFNSNSVDTVNVLLPNDNAQTTIKPTKIPSASTEDTAKNNSLPLFANADGATVVPSKVEGINNADKEKRFVELDNNTDNATDKSKRVDNPFFNGKEEKQAPKKEKIVDYSDEAISKLQLEPISEKDFYKMQKKMVSRQSEDEMLTVLDKYVKEKSLTTEQIKYLGTLFLSDAGRFALFQDLLPHVSDKDKYPLLQDQLLDKYFKEKFVKMLKN